MQELRGPTRPVSGVNTRRTRRLDLGATLSRGTWLALLLAFTTATEVSAQFSAKGRGPRPTPSTNPNQATSPAVAKPEAPRSDTLIARYEKLILSQPGEEVPLTRLAELVRERDGNLKAILDELARKASQEGERYPALVAWGGMLAQDEQIELAIEKLKQAVGLLPDRPAAWLLLGRLEQSQGRFEDARRSIERALPHVTGPERSMLVRTLRDLSLDQGDVPAAKKYHDELTREAKGNLFLQGELGRELLRRGKTAEAITELQRVAKAARGEPRSEAPALRDLGQAQMEGNQLPQAITSLERASKLAVSQPGLRVAIDTLLADAHRQAGSLSTFLETLAASAHRPERLGLLGQLYEEEGRTAEAIEAYKKALAQGAGDIDLRLRLVRLYEVTGNIDGAVDEYEKLVRASPDDVSLSLRFMEMLLARGERDKTIREWDRIEARTRNNPDAGLMLLDMASRLEESTREKQMLSRLSQANSRDPRFLIELGSRHYQEGDSDAAKATWKKILLVHRDRAQAHVTYGEVLIDHESAEEGIDELRKAALLSPDDPKIHQALALGLERVATTLQGANRTRYENEALQHFRKVLDLIEAKGQSAQSEQSESLARRHIVRIYKRNGQLEEALLPLEGKLRKKPPDLAAGRLLAEAYLALRRDEAAIDVLKTIVEHAPGDRQALLQLEAAHTRLEDYGAAMLILERLIEADPRRAQEYYERMARAASLQNDSVGALKYAELAVRRNPGDATSQAQLGDLYQKSGRPQDAENAYRKALAQDDRLHLVSLRLAELLAKTERADEALDVLFHVVRTAREHDIVRRATRRALSLSVPLGQTRQVEETLRPLAVSRPEQPLYRSLLLEVLSSETYPLLLREGHGSREERAKARTELAELADRSTGPLLAALSGDNKGEQKTAILLLSRGRTSGAALALLAFAESSADLDQRLLAVLALGQMEGQDSSERVIALAMTEDSVKRGRIPLAALWVIAKVGDHRKVDALLRALDEGDPEMRAYAALGLSDSHGARALSPRTRQRALDSLVELLRSKSGGTVARAAAVLALGRLAGWESTPLENRRAVHSEIASATEDRSSLVAQAAFHGLAYNAQFDGVAAVLARGLFHHEAAVREAATAAVASRVEQGKNTKRVFADLLPETLGPPELDARLRLAAAFDSLDKTDRPARHRALVQMKSALIEEGRVGLRASAPAASAVLDQLELTTAGPTFGRLLTAPDLELADDADSIQAQKAAVEIRKGLLPEIIALAEGPQPDLRMAALRALAPTDGDIALGVLLAGLRDDHASVQQAALEAMTRTTDEGALGSLADYLSDEPSWARRRRAAQALGALLQRTPSGPGALRVEKLLRSLTSDPSPLVEQEAREALGSDARSNRPQAEHPQAER